MVGCRSLKKTGSPIVQLNYNFYSEYLHPDFFIHHAKNDSSYLYFKIDEDNLLFQKNANTDQFESSFVIKYGVYQSLKTGTILDSISTNFSAQKKTVPVNVSGKIPFKIANGNYLLRVKTVDKTRGAVSTSILTIDKSPNCRQNYLIYDANQNDLQYNNYFSPLQKLKIIAPTANQKIFGRYYNRDFPLAAPPFSVFNKIPFKYSADSTFEVNSNNDGELFLTMPSSGFIHLQTDTTQKKGLTLFVFDDNYPYLGEHTDMLSPLRYLCSKKEFEDLNDEQTAQKAVEEFWLEHSGSKERAREVIKHFYHRVQFANQYFSSYLEGWKSDRGIVYLVYGPPNKVEKDDFSETWIYGESNNVMSVNFTFVKVENPFTDNDFSLSRNPRYKLSWYRAVESWRNGRVFSTK